jgi:hypothetical protein
MQNENQTNPEIKKNKNVIIYILSAVVIAAVVLFLLLTGKGSRYDKGNEFLRDKKYNEAISEFQKVGTGDKNFPLAQSKINYINGLNAYNDGLFPQALVFLSKVNTDDEYYHDSQLMIQKINEPTTQNNLQSQIDSLKRKKDTVIVKREIETKEKGKKTETLTDQEISKRYVQKLDGIISKFEAEYQSAAGASVASKRDYVSNMESTRKQFMNQAYDAKEKDAEINLLKTDISNWMDKRIAFINQLIAENSIGVNSDIARRLKEEGDKNYSVERAQYFKVKKIYP